MNRDRILVTGSAGHLGEALVRILQADGYDVVGLDLLESPFTTVVGSVTDRELVRSCLPGVTAVLHTATLHKPHVASHDRSSFVDTNVAGTLVLLEEAVAAGVARFVLTSTTSTFGRALTPAPGAPAAWITEAVTPVPRNIYGVTKTAAEDLCQLIARDEGLGVVVLRTARFFPEPDDRDEVRNAYEDANLKANEYLYRRVDLEDVVSAHRQAMERAPEIGFAKYIVSATTPFRPSDAAELAVDAPAVVGRLFPEQEAEYARRGWRMFPRLDRVYDNARARAELGWEPALRLRHGVGTPPGRRRPSQPVGSGGGSQGLPRGVDRPVHHPLRQGPGRARRRPGRAAGGHRRPQLVTFGVSRRVMGAQPPQRAADI